MATLARRVVVEVEEHGSRLSEYCSRYAEVIARAIEPDSESMEEDGADGSEFMVEMHYKNHKDGASNSMMFKGKKEEVKEYFDDELHVKYDRRETFVILEWLDQLGVVREEVVHGITVEVVLDGLRWLIEEAQRGQKYLAIMVDIEVLDGRGHGQGLDWSMFDIEEYDHDDQFEEVFEFEEEEGFVVEDEEVVKANMEVAKVDLSTSGVKFVTVCSSMTYKLVGRCAICLESFEDDVKKSSDRDQTEEEAAEVKAVVAVLRCSHTLHQDCLLCSVAIGNSTCPLCRDDVLSSGHFEGGDKIVLVFIHLRNRFRLMLLVCNEVYLNNKTYSLTTAHFLSRSTSETSFNFGRNRLCTALKVSGSTRNNSSET